MPGLSKHEGLGPHPFANPFTDPRMALVLSLSKDAASAMPA